MAIKRLTLEEAKTRLQEAQAAVRLKEQQIETLVASVKKANDFAQEAADNNDPEREKADEIFIRLTRKLEREKGTLPGLIAAVQDAKLLDFHARMEDQTRRLGAERRACMDGDAEEGRIPACCGRTRRLQAGSQPAMGASDQV
jgi:hypothetical protein